MPRPLRITPGGYVYHVFNRSNACVRIFSTNNDFLAFEHTLSQACEREKVKLICYIIMPNHWHLVIWPQQDGDLSRFMAWLTMTHSQRWHAYHGTTGTGHLYQGRFKSFPVQTDTHFLTLCRYVERNALAAGLVKNAEGWPWCSLWQRQNKKGKNKINLAQWPVERPENWSDLVNQPFSEAELYHIKQSINRDRPFGQTDWTSKTAEKLGIINTLRLRGRPPLK